MKKTIKQTDDSPQEGARATRYWYDCDECGKFILKEVNGKEYYHSIECSLTNGLDYDKLKNMDVNARLGAR